MMSCCMIDDDVVAGAGAGAKFILLKRGDTFVLVSKCFPAYRFAPATLLIVSFLQISLQNYDVFFSLSATTPTSSSGRASMLLSKRKRPALQLSRRSRVWVVVSSNLIPFRDLSKVVQQHPAFVAAHSHANASVWEQRRLRSRATTARAHVPAAGVSHDLPNAVALSRLFHSRCVLKLTLLQLPVTRA